MTESGIVIADTHAHLDASEFDEDREAVIIRASEAGVSRILTCGTSVSSSRRAIEIAESHEEVFAATGIHPHDAGAVTEGQVDEIERLSGHPRVVAIGEIGLDFYRDYAPRDRQLDALRWQLHVATRRGLPVILHARGAHDEMLDVLTEWLAWHNITEASGSGPAGTAPAGVKPAGVLHCFMGDAATARRYLDMGLMISLAGYVSYPQPVVTEEAVKSIPADRLMAETDCPFLPPQPYRGRRNEPAYVRHTVQTLAEIRGVSFEALARETSENARRLFGW